MAAVTAGRTAQIKSLLTADSLASEVVNLFLKYEQYRINWTQEKDELIAFLFATDTTTTSNKKLPWKNSTTLPKLTQLRDNLHANYMTALQSGDWVTWVGTDTADATKIKKETIKQYMLHKLRTGGFYKMLSKLVLDYIDYGNAFADVEYVVQSNEVDGEKIPGYVGPRAVRISPLDLTFNPLAGDYEDSPKMLRTVMPLGDLLVLSEERPDLGYDVTQIEKSIFIRNEWKSYSQGERNKANQYRRDGFGDLSTYYDSGTVEIIELEGNVYDWAEQKLHKNAVITVIDRQLVIRNETNPSWLPKGSKVHAPWRERPDNLYGMGPLDNLVGLQYRIDHLENLKADAFDLTIHPPYTTRGSVEDFTWQPAEEIVLGEDGEIAFLPPESGVLQTDNEILFLESKMEEYAGAPKLAMGIRTPGEKTAFEVSVLDTAASRIFATKVRQFEEHLLEPLLNHMLETARRNWRADDVIRVTDVETGVGRFVTVTKEDITAEGKITAAGSKHFIAKSNVFQTFMQLSNSSMGADPAIMNHISGLEIAELLFDDLLGAENRPIVRENIRIAEATESARMQQAAQSMLEDESVVDTETLSDEAVEDLNG